MLGFVSGNAQGLLFNSNDSLLGQRTSYDVFAGSRPTFKETLSIHFDLSIWDKKHFGYVFCLRDPKSKSYSLSYIYSDDHIGYLYLNIDNESAKIKIPLPAVRLMKRQWMQVQVDFDLKNDKVSVRLDGQEYHADHMGLQQSMRPALVFGRYEYFTDVPSMALKNLLVKDPGKTWFFPLDEWNGNIVHAKDGAATGATEHPNWLINESWFWKERFSARFNEVAGLAFNDSSQQIMMYRSHQLLTYDLLSGQTTTQSYKEDLPVAMILGKSVWNTRENKLYVYEVNNLPHGWPTMASLQPDSLTWQITGAAYVPEQRHHHNAFYDKDQQQLYLFGGYGSFTYFNKFFQYHRETDKWEQITFTGDTIAPRFFSAASKADQNNELYIFGGFGNQSGNQIVGGKHLYDLYRVNLDKRTIHKCWEIPAPEKNFVPANNLVLSADGKYAYVICYAHHIARTNLLLYRFSIADGSYEMVSSPIPIISEKIETDINLFYNQYTREFYCAVQEFADAKNSTIRLFSLAAPPVSYSSYLHAIHEEAHHSRLVFIVLGVLVLGLIGLAVYLYRMRSYQAETLADKATAESDALEAVQELTPELTIREDVCRTSAVYLLGAFTVYDKKSRDITYLFSPKIRQLFILILLHHKTDSGGVSSKTISQILWPEKEVTKTKNSRGVTLNHLRGVLNDLEGIRLSFANETYCLEVTDDFYCDYFAITAMAKRLQGPDTDDSSSYVELLSRGTLLSAMPEPWLDEFKHTFEEGVLTISQPALKKAYQNGQQKVALKLTKIILQTDPFHDEALQYQLELLKKMKGMTAARKRYDAFVADYKKSMGTDYPHPFEKMSLP